MVHVCGYEQNQSQATLKVQPMFNKHLILVGFDQQLFLLNNKTENWSKYTLDFDQQLLRI